MIISQNHKIPKSQNHKIRITFNKKENNETNHRSKKSNKNIFVNLVGINDNVTKGVGDPVVPLEHHTCALCG